VEAILEPGDSIITRHGDSHSVACHGDETLVLLAAILPY
jgi:quercetin dioxygenase-like cupin family protein